MALQIGTFTINLRKKLGRGHFGTVYPATDRYGYKIAAKQLESSSRAALMELENTRRQQNLLHENIVKIFDIHIEEADEEIWMFMEFCSGGDLNNYSKQNFHDLQRIKLNLMKQMATGLSYLHECRIAHRDIKPENILLQSQPGVDGIIAKLTDFGLAKFHSPAAENSVMTTNLGTQIYKAPEFWDMDTERKIHYHKIVDVYALALTYQAILNAEEGKNLRPTAQGCLPDEHYQPIGLVMFNRQKHKEPELSVANITAMDSREIRGIKNIIQRGTSVRPGDRPIAAQIVKQLKV